MILDIDDPIVGAYLASTDQLVQINNEAWANEWSACWSEESKLLNAVNANGTHVIVPLLHASRGIPTSPSAFRCYLWYLVPNNNDRMCTLVDVSAETLGTLVRMEGHALERLVVLLFAELTLTPKN
jgi:hypothetical protein